MTYAVKEIFKTIQGEGAQAGKVSVFCRFSGCNLWSGREEDRLKSVCQFCDTDFVGIDGTFGGRYVTAEDLVQVICQVWGSEREHRYVVLTGGEPGLQIDPGLVHSLHAENFTIAVETNGTIDLPYGLDWICVSPKAGAKLKLTAGDELKLVYPQQGLQPSDFSHLLFKRFSLQPMDGRDVRENTSLAIDYCMKHPQWSLSTQTHKQLGIR